MDLVSKYCYFYHSWDFVPYKYNYYYLVDHVLVYPLYLTSSGSVKLYIPGMLHIPTGTCGQDPPPFFLNIDFFFM